MHIGQKRVEGKKKKKKRALYLFFCIAMPQAFNNTKTEK